jgi:hypothetical protein
MVDRAAEPVKLTHDMMHRDKQEDRRRMKPWRNEMGGEISGRQLASKPGPRMRSSCS